MLSQTLWSRYTLWISSIATETAEVWAGFLVIRNEAMNENILPKSTAQQLIFRYI